MMFPSELKTQSREVYDRLAEQHGEVTLGFGICSDGTMFVYDPETGKVVRSRGIEFRDEPSGLRSLVVTLPVIHEPIIVKGR